MKKTILLFLITLISGFIMQNMVSAAEIKFAQVADVHYMTENENGTRVLEKTIEDINAQDDLSFVVFTGDNIDSAKPHYLKEFVKIINKLDIPYYLVIGNHDVFKNGGLSKEKYIEIIHDNNFFYGPRKPNYVFKKNGFVFIIVDGAKEVIPGTIGYYKKDTLEWLDKNLVKYKNQPVVIMQHFPLIEPKPTRSHKTHEAEVYLDLLKKHDNVVALLSGHYHLNNEIMQDGIYHISTPSLIGDPHAYKIINIITTKEFSPMIYTELKEIEYNEK